jgi:acetyltransferase-like isoleucine patch superfamily enzyme
MDHFATIGQGCIIQKNVILGFKYKAECKRAKIGDNAIIRSNTIIYGDVIVNDNFQSGHNVVIREHSIFGNHIVVGTNTVIDGHVKVGDFVKIESNCYIPTHVTIGSRTFIGPGVVMTNDKYPQKMRDEYQPEGPVIEDGVSLGGGVVVIPAVTIGRGSFVAAGAVVTKNVPPMSLVVGVPGRIYTLPKKLQEFNMAKNWRKYLNEGN